MFVIDNALNEQYQEVLGYSALRQESRPEA